MKSRCTVRQCLTLVDQGRRPKNQHRAPSQGTAFSCSGVPFLVSGGLSTARFMAKLLMEVTSSCVVARWLQVQFLVSLFQKLQGEERSHNSSRVDGSRNFHEAEGRRSNAVHWKG